MLENLKFKKPWFGNWQISFNVRNRTDHNLEALNLQFVFFNKAREVVSDPKRIPAYRIALLPDGQNAALPVVVTIPSDLRPERAGEADLVRPYLVSFRARMNGDDIALVGGMQTWRFQRRMVVRWHQDDSADLAPRLLRDLPRWTTRR